MAPLAYEQGKIFATSYGGGIFALDPETGVKLWGYETAAPVASAPSVNSRAVYAGDMGGTVYALDSQTGRFLWKTNKTLANGTLRNVTYTRINGVLATDRYVYVSSAGTIYAADAASGEKAWGLRANDSTTGFALSSDGKLYFGSGEDLVAIDSNTGSEKWRAKAGSPWRALPELAGNLIYLGGTDGVMRAFSAADGSLVWGFKAGGWLETTALESDGKLYFGADDFNVYALDSRSGELIWKSQGTDAISAKPILVNTQAGSELVIFSTDGTMHGLSTETGAELWHAKIDDSRFSDGVDSKAGVIYAGSRSGVFAAELTGCSIDDPLDEAAVPNGYVLVRGTGRAENGVRQVAVSVNGEKFETAFGKNKWAYAFDASKLSQDEMTIECKVTDEDGSDEAAPLTKITATRSNDVALAELRVTGYGRAFLPGDKITINVTDAKYGDAIPEFTARYGAKSYDGKNGKLELVAAGDGVQHIVVSAKGYGNYDAVTEVNGGGSTTLLFGGVIAALLIAGGYFLFRKPRQAK